LLATLAISAAAGVWWRASSALRYEVIGATQNGSYVNAPANHPVSLRFSDETEVDLLGGSQLRVAETSREGARLVLERGSLGVHVVHRDGSRWKFEAGPIEVWVTGTRFDLKWDPAAELLELRLHEGSVQIQTPLSPAPIALGAGQAFRADLIQRSTTTTDANSPAPAAEAEPAATLPAPPAPIDTLAAAPAVEVPSAPRAPHRSAVAASSPRSWSKLVASGEFNTVLALASQRGITRCVRTCSASDLSALADAARYSGQNDLAEQALRALRSRFAGEAEGRAAAFLLGRLREAGEAPSDARSWYETYERETPDGAYSAEALAGTLRMALKLDGASAAEPIAREYLRRYPSGVHAGMARRVLGSR
jgi:TolA-binding protein